MLNKKGQGLQVSTVIIIILALLVLVILAVIVTGGFAEFAKKLGLIKDTIISLDDAKLKCQSWCNSPLEDVRKKFCGNSEDDTFKIDANGDGKVDDIKYKCDQLGLKCPAVDCS